MMSTLLRYLPVLVLCDDPASGRRAACAHQRPQPRRIFLTVAAAVAFIGRGQRSDDNNIGRALFTSTM